MKILIIGLLIMFNAQSQMVERIDVKCKLELVQKENEYGKYFCTPIFEGFNFNGIGQKPKRAGFGQREVSFYKTSEKDISILEKNLTLFFNNENLKASDYIFQYLGFEEDGKKIIVSAWKFKEKWNMSDEFKDGFVRHFDWIDDGGQNSILLEFDINTQKFVRRK